MKIIGQTGRDYIAQLTEEEIAILLGFPSVHNEGYRTWKRGVARRDDQLEAGTDIQVREIAAFWLGIQYREAEATKCAATLRALADLITSNLPSGIVPPAQPQEEPQP